MNKERVQNIRDVMASMIGSDKVNMINYQTVDTIEHKNVCTLEEFHKCGNTACFAVVLALTPMFKEAGGRMKGASKDLKPVLKWAKARGWSASILKRRCHIKLTKPGHRSVFSSLTT